MCFSLALEPLPSCDFREVDGDLPAPAQQRVGHCPSGQAAAAGRHARRWQWRSQRLSGSAAPELATIVPELPAHHSMH